MAFIENLIDSATTVGAKAAPVATYGGSATAILGGINDMNTIAVIGGILIGLAGFFLNWYYKAKHDRREQTEHNLRMVLRGDRV